MVFLPDNPEFINPGNKGLRLRELGFEVSGGRVAGFQGCRVKGLQGASVKRSRGTEQGLPAQETWWGRLWFGVEDFE